MTTNTPTPSRTIRIQVSEKGKLRLVDADLFPGQGDASPEPYQKRHQLSDMRSFDDGEALLRELRMLAFDRRDAGQKIDPDELLPFLDDLQAVLVRAVTITGDTLFRMSLTKDLIKGWIGPQQKLL